MAKFILRNAFIEVNGVNLSDHCSQVEIDDGADEVDVTSMGAANKETLLGIGDAQITATFFQDFAEGSVDATLHAVYKSNTPFLVKVRPDSAAKGVTNPEYIMNAVLPSYKSLSGSVGAASTTDVAFKNAAASGVERKTS